MPFIPRRSLVLLLTWIAILAALGWYVQKDLVVGTDLRLFLPNPTTPEQRLLLEEIGEGPASRVLVVAIEGDTPENLADASRQLVAELATNKHFRVVTNGEVALDAIPEDLLAYRYLLSPTLDAQRFDARYLSEQLQTRLRDLGSPAGTLLEPILPRDPTLEILKLVQSWQPMQEPNRLYDVWFDAQGKRALLIAETVAPAFDPDQQRAALDDLRATFAHINGSGPMKLEVSGPGSFSVLMEGRTRGEAQTLGTIATVGMIVLLLVAYRRVRSVVVSALPLASAGIVGLLAVSLLFDAVHGITLAFGFTLIGVAQDYPMHLLSHARPGRSPVESARELWPTLATGVASTCIAYATFLFSGVTGLAQLACFTVASLAAAGLTTRFLLPHLIGSSARDFGDSEFLGHLWNRIATLPRPRWAGLVLVILCIGALALPGPMWENDLSKLTPVPQDLLLEDQEIRSQLGTPDLRYLMVVEAPNDDAALQRLEQLDTSLGKLKEQGAIGGYDHAARYVPTGETQLARQQRLPDEASLRSALTQALEGTPFRPEVFDPFIEDVAHARDLPPLTVQALRDSPLGATFDLLLSSREGKSTAIVTFTDVKDPQALTRLATNEPDTLLLDLKDASESLVARQRTHLLWSLAVASVLLIAVVAFALRSPKRVLRVLAPMALTTLLLLAALHGLGIALTLFHLIALILAAGLGLDYALFFEHAADDPREQRRTLHAVLVCSLSTLMVFALLATSSLPVLRAIGLTVTLGVISNFVLALLLTREAGAGRGVWGEEKAAQIVGSASDPQTVPRTLSPLASLIPHQGSMCLLERVIEWNDQRITLATDTHRMQDNPLRSQDELKAVHLCEYGAQAMAVHGALQAQAKGSAAAPGMLVSLRAVSLHCERIDTIDTSLVIEADCLQSTPASQQYAFRISAGDQLLCEGRAAVVLKSSE